MNERARDLLSKPAILIPLVSAASYAVAYGFESNYLAYFGVSHHFIEISINTFVLSAFFISMVILFAITPINLVQPIYHSLSKTGWGRFWRFMIMTGFALAIPIVAIGLRLNVDTWALLGLFMIVWGGIVLAIIGDELIFTSKQKGIKKRLQFAFDKSKPRSPGLPLPKAVDSALSAIFGVGLIVSVGMVAGGVYARWQDDFLVYHWGSKDYVLIYDQGGREILKELTNEKLGSEILVVTSKEVDHMTFKVRRIKDIR
ncbi:MAG TPA: hypothetical protein VLA88_01920 [Candidatus Saccharimonadales bacterium]|nr:hypothetical protein [Candidatus Saccharimonadales bacterium]